MKFISPSQLDSSNPGTWPIYYKIAVWIFIIGILLFTFNNFFIEPANENIRSNEEKIVKLKDDYRDMYQKTLDLEVYRARSKELISILEDLLKFLPLKTEIAQLIDNVRTAATDSNINIDGFTPEKLIKEEYYDTMPITLVTNTEYRNFANFSESLTHLERIMNIADFELRISDYSEQSDFNFVLLSVKAQMQTYIYNQDIEALRRGELPQQQETGGR